MRLLLAEDEKSLSRAVAAILKHSGYEVDVVYDGVSALEYLMAGRCDGAILDIMMPRMDGLEVLHQLRQRGNRIPVLMLTAKSEINDKVTGLDCGANDYMTKPFAVPEFLARIRALVREKNGQEPTRLSLGNLTLDRTQMELSSPTGSFRLTSQEFQMMEIFFCSAGHRIQAEDLLERIWGMEGRSEQEVVNVYISYLRKKTAALHGSLQIEGSMAKGYVLEEIP